MGQLTDKQKKGYLNRIRWWSIALGIFIIVQLTFLIIDGTSFEPNLNDSDNIFGRYANWILESKLFNEWITLYSFPWFNLVTIVFIIFLLANAVTDILSIKRIKQHRS
jgi:YfzA-like protein